MLDSISPSVFSNAQSVYMTPVVSAEWNHNLFTPPYLTVAGTGTSIAKTLKTGTVSDVTSGAKPNFTTKSFQTVNGTGSVTYEATSLTGKAYKIITYVKTNALDTILITASAKGTSSQYGSANEELDSFGWTKLITYIGASSPTETVTSFTYTIFSNPANPTTDDSLIYFTVPEIYETTYFDYRNNSLFPTSSAFEYFRPGESYVTSGDSRCTLPTNYRKIEENVIDGYTSPAYSPISSIIQNPHFFLASPPVPAFKTVLPSSIARYKYFVSDETSRSITGIYESALRTNKLVIKFNALMTVPTVNIYINGTIITVDGSTSITPPVNGDGKASGLLTLYWTGSAWTKSKWTTPPSLNSAGALSISTTVSKITVTQISQNTNTEFESYTSESVTGDIERMQVIEISPRLEIDLTNLVESVNIDKSLDSNSSVLPISAINSNDANIKFTGIPGMNGDSVVPIFSMQSTQSTTILANIMRKNVKVYVGYILSGYSNLGGSTTTSNTYIPGGVFYSDDWQESDMESVSVQAYDSSRFLQSLPVSDYVANLKTVFEVITNILDLSGFSDYDYDSLFQICNDPSSPMDLSYYYCNSQDTTVMDALNQLFMAYQIGAYIDEYGVMKFLSLKKIMLNQESTLSIDDYSIIEGGYSSSVAPKPGSVSLRYQTPKIKQSPSLANSANSDIKNSPSFVYTTSNDVVWQQQSIDSVGFNYLNEDMPEFANSYNLNVNDLLDIFHTFNISSNGYAFIENEVVSFEYKEFTISNSNGSETVRVKNNLELNAAVSNFIKKYDAQLRISYAEITNVSANGTDIVYTADNTFRVGDKVIVTAVDPQKFNIAAKIKSRNDTSFTIESDVTGSYVSGGEATIFSDYDVVVAPTGNITGVKRGLFGTSPTEHKRITNLASKGLSEASISSSFVVSPTTGRTAVIDNYDSSESLPHLLKLRVTGVESNKTIVYPSTARDEDYHTYSVKFDMDNQDTAAAGVFFNMADPTDTTGTYFVELIRTNKTIPGTQFLFSPPRYRYILAIYDAYGTMYSWSDVTGECNSVIDNFSKILIKDDTTKPTTYSYVTDNPISLKVVRNVTDGSDGENATEAQNMQTLSVFINNIEITGWMIPAEPYDENTNPEGSGWKPTEINRLTGMRQKPVIYDDFITGTVFGFYASLAPVTIDVNPPIEYPALSSIYPASLREIHATKKPLTERSVSYFYQDREFLNGMVQDQALYNLSPTYIMQTTPEVSGINIYDIQYMTPAAVSVDILPIEYKMVYFPGEDPEDKKSYQVKFVDEYSLAYSTPINTGFRGIFAVANNSPHLVFLSKESDGMEAVTVNFNLWTHEIIAPSDPSILDVIIDPGNPSEVVQIDSEWIQSLDAAKKLMRLIERSIDGFSRTVTVQIFGNPLIQIGDVVTLSYYLKGLSEQKYVVHSVSNIFESGLKTSLVLKKL